MTDVERPEPQIRPSLQEEIRRRIKTVVDSIAEAPEKTRPVETSRPFETDASVESQEFEEVVDPGGGSSSQGGGGDRTSGGTTPEPTYRPVEQARPAPRGAHIWFERHAGWLTLATTAVLLIAIVAVATEHSCEWVAPVMLVTLAAFLLSVILLFTRPLEVESDVNTIFRFGWGFAVATTILGLLFAYFGFKPLDPDGDTAKNPPPKQQNQSASATPAAPERKRFLLAIVPGCDYDSIPFVNGTAPVDGKAETAAGAQPLRGTSGRLANPSMPTNVNCGELPPQWVLSIGGSILSCHFDGICPKAPVRPDISQLEKQHARASRELAAQHALLSQATKHLSAKHGFNLADLKSLEIPAGDFAADIAGASERIAKLTGALRSAEAQIAAAKKWDQFNWNIAGSPIVGGVVIPIYFLAIALLGALVNMTRKMPEFQQRVDPSYPKEFVEVTAAGGGPLPPVSWPRARDLVVFQILQVLTAPAVAILAYSWASPEQMWTTVILAFAAGFSSEVFLVAIRGVVDRAIGLGPRPALARAAVQAKTTTATETLPPRGSSTAAPESSGGFKIGDSVILVKPVGPFLPGTTGVVLSIEPGGELVVSTTADHTGMPVHFRLQSQPPESFRHPGADTAPANEPSG